MPLKMPPRSGCGEEHLPGLRRLVLALEPLCRPILPQETLESMPGFVSTRLIALFNLAYQGILPEAIGNANWIIGSFGERLAALSPQLENNESALRLRPNPSPNLSQSRRRLPTSDRTKFARCCTAFIAPLKSLERAQCKALADAFCQSAKKASRIRGQESSAETEEQFLNTLGADCLAAGWAHEYLCEKQTQSNLKKTQFFTPSWIADYLCGEAINGRQDFTLLDPACGAGHLLVGVLRTCATAAGGEKRQEALADLLQNGIFGLDIDVQLIDIAAFSLYLAARQLIDSDEPIELPLPRLFCPAGPIGSLAACTGLQLQDWQGKPILLPAKFDAIVMNPPYLSTRTMDDTTADFLRKHFSDASGDLYTAFVQLAMRLLKPGGRLSTIVQQSFLSITRYRSLRLELFKKMRLITCLQLGTGAFPSRPGEKVNNAIITVEQPPDDAGEKKNVIANHTIRHLRLHGRHDHFQAMQDGLAAIKHAQIDRAEAEELINSLSGQPFAFHCPREIAAIFDSAPGLAQLRDDFVLTNGLFTCDNKRFVKLTADVAAEEEGLYVPYDKGGGKKWYQRTPYSLRWGTNGDEIRQFRVERGQSRSLPGENFYFRPGLTYSYIGTKGFSARLLSDGAVFDIASSAVFSLRHDLNYLLGFFNSALVAYLLSLLNPTINFQIGDLRRLPFKSPQPEFESTIGALSGEAVGIARSLVESSDKRQDKAICADLIKREGLIQREIDELIFDHYGLSKAARAAVMDEPWVRRGRRPIA